MELRDVLTFVSVALTLVLGTRLWLRDGRKDGAEQVRAFVRLEAAVDALHTRLAEMRTEVHGLAARLEARDAADHESVLRELDHVRSEVHDLAARVARAESWQAKASAAPPAVIARTA